MDYYKFCSSMLSSSVDLQGELRKAEAGGWKFEVRTSSLRPLFVNCGIESLGCGNAIRDVWSCRNRDVEVSESRGIATATSCEV